MFWQYMKFELKLLLRNKKNWLLCLAVVLFFPLYYTQYSKMDIEDMKKVKNEEADHMMTIFHSYPESFRYTEKGAEIYDYLTQQSSLINMQRFYLWKKDDYDRYVENGLKIGEIRLKIHELDNEGLHPNYVFPKEEIYKEMALMRYYQEHELPLVPDPLVASNYLPVTLDMISGPVFVLFVLLMGAGMMQYEQRHRSVLSGFPISFMKKVESKVSGYLLQITVFLIAGVAVGGYYASTEAGWGDFLTPVLLFNNGDFTAVSTTVYLVLMLIAMILIASLLLHATALLNVLTKNMYATVLILFFMYLVPDLLTLLEVNANLLYPIKFMDIANVLNGDAAKAYSNDRMDVKHAYIWLIALNAITAGALYLYNYVIYRKRAAVPAELKVEG